MQNQCKYQNACKIMKNLLKMARHPKGVQGVQNEPNGVQKAPRSVKEASRRRKARFTRVLYHFLVTLIHRRHAGGSPNNLPVREVN